MLRLVAPVSRRRQAPAVASLGQMTPDAEAFLRELRRLGLRSIVHCRLTANRNVLVSFGNGVLRIHRGYRTAPPDVVRAIVQFVERRSPAVRRAALAVLKAYPIRTPRRPARIPTTHPDDRWMLPELEAWHRRFNLRYFDCALPDVPIRVSRRMRGTLGQYFAATPELGAPEIVISRRHLEDHGWEEVKHTLLHEMVHQWQDVAGLSIDHGTTFRDKAAAVGITPAACRTLTSRPGHAHGERTVQRSAARSR